MSSAEKSDDKSYRSKSENVKPALGPDLLVMLPPRSVLFDNVSTSGSEISEISGPFSDFGNVPEAETSDRRSEDLEEHELSGAFAFSSDFRTVMDEIKVENLKTDPSLSEVASMMAESFHEIAIGAKMPVIHKKIPVAIQMKIFSLLNDKELQFNAESSDEEPEKGETTGKKSKDGTSDFVPDDKKTWEDIKDEILGTKKSVFKEVKKLKKKEKVKKEVAKEKEEEQAYETMSGYWRLLSVYDDFTIAPPDFNAYEQDPPHWLQTKPVPLTVMENSRKKCIEWLDRHFETY